MTTDGTGPLVQLDGLKLYFPIKSFGRHASAIAIIARWRMPPENWCG